MIVVIEERREGHLKSAGIRKGNELGLSKFVLFHYMIIL